MAKLRSIDGCVEEYACGVVSRIAPAPMEEFRTREREAVCGSAIAIREGFRTETVLYPEAFDDIGREALVGRRIAYQHMVDSSARRHGDAVLHRFELMLMDTGELFKKDVYGPHR